jgi:2-keto-4-pentenoate hydratase
MVAALAEQLARRRAALEAGAEHVGWKLGIGKREQIGGEIAVGYLTSHTLLAAGGTFGAADAGDLRADAEIFVELGDDGPMGYGGALELVDLAEIAGEPESVIVTNVYHRAVVFGDARPTLPRDLHVELRVNGDVRGEGDATDDLAGRLVAASRVLAAAGEAFQRGDRIITGNVVQVRVAPGDEVVADFGALGSVALRIALP